MQVADKWTSVKKETSEIQWMNLTVVVRLKIETKISETCICKKAGNNEVVSIKQSSIV